MTTVTIQRLGSLLGAALLVAQTLPLTAAEVQRYLVAARGGNVAAGGMRVAAASVEEPRHRVRAFEAFGAFAADLTAEEAAELSRSRDLIVEPVVPRYAESAAAALPPFRPANDTTPQELPWGISAVHAPDVWPVTTGTKVNVVVLDTGIDGTHPDLAHAYAGGYNAFQPELPPTDAHRHGTHVAGTIAAANNGVGVVGVAPGVKLWAVKVLGDDGEGTSESVVNGMNWVIEKAKRERGRWVINMSLGSTLYSAVEQLAMSEAVSAGIAVVASAGNLGTDLVKYPGAYDDVIAVGAVTEAHARAPFSSYGRGLKIMAPGAEVRSTIIPGYDYAVGVRTATGTPSLDAWRVDGSPFITVTARVIDCGVGDPEQFPEAVRGNIAFIRRGKYLFREMARHANAAGAAAFVVQNYSTDASASNKWTFYPDPPEPEWDNFPWPLAVGMRFEKAAALLDQPENVTLSYTTNIYGTMNGTSMASPHVAATVALLLALDPSLSIAQVEYVLRVTATDLETPGWSYQTGWGMVDALKAAKWVAPEKFAVPPPQPPPPGRRRSVR